MSLRILTTALFLLSSLALQAGVVITIETTKNGAIDISRMVAQDNALAMEVEGDADKAEMIFRGDLREMVVVDHGSNSYMVIDEATVQEIAARLKAAAAQMEQAMANMPESVRRQMQQMQKNGSIPGMPAQVGGEKTSPLEIRRTNRQETRQGYPCTAVEMLRDGRIVRELWVTEWDNVPGSEEISGLFEGMAGFMSELAESFQGSMGAQMGAQIVDEAFAAMNAIDGFPVVTREFGPDGAVESESTLKSSEEQALDPARFNPPSDYRKRSLGL